MAVIQGTAGNDFLVGYDGNDFLDGYDGNDFLDGGDNNDRLDSGAGEDTLVGGAGEDTLVGYIGNDRLDGGFGNDLLIGALNFRAPGQSSIVGGPGEIDTLTGGAGTDTFAGISYYDDRDPLNAGTVDYALIKDFKPYEDFIRLSGAKTNYFLGASPDGLPQGTAIFFDKPGTEADEIIGIVENESGLNLNDSYFTTTVDDFFFGTDGVDSFDSGEGNDFLYGYDGDDIFTAGNGNDTLRGDNGNDSLTGSDGNDIFFGGNGNDSLTGGDGDDTLTGTFEIFTFAAGIGTGEIDFLAGGAGRDKFILGDVSRPYRSPTFGAVYYDDANTTAAGTTDYALIQDFDSSQDVIQLLGTAANYILDSSSASLSAGTGIYVDKPNSDPDELIAIVQGISPSSLSLTAAYFSYVTSDKGSFGPIF